MRERRKEPIKVDFLTKIKEGTRASTHITSTVKGWLTDSSNKVEGVNICINITPWFSGQHVQTLFFISSILGSFYAFYWTAKHKRDRKRKKRWGMKCNKQGSTLIHRCPLKTREPMKFILTCGVFVLNVPEADSVPVSVEGLEVLLIVNPLFASRTDGHTSSSWNRNTWDQWKHR